MRTDGLGQQKFAPNMASRDPVHHTALGRRAWRVLFAIALTLWLTIVLFGELGAKLGRFAVPEIAIGWALLVALVILVAVPRSSERLSFRRFVTVAAILFLCGFPLMRWWMEHRHVASPLAAHVSRRVGEPSERTQPLLRLDVPARRYLARIARRRRNVALDIRGFVYVPRAGDYRFDMSCDDRCEIRIGGETVLKGEGSRFAVVNLVRGVHPLTIIYAQTGGPALLLLSWDRPDVVELFPLEAYVGGDEASLTRRRFALEPFSRSLFLGATLAWFLVASLLCVRLSETRTQWSAELVSVSRRWLARPASAEPIALVRPRPWLAAGIAFAMSAGLVSWRTPGWIETAKEQYSVNPLRMPYVLERLEGYPLFLLFMAVLCVAVAAALRFSRGAESMGPSPRMQRRLLLCGIAVSLLCGAFLSEREWMRYGQPCYDYYCDFAELVRAGMLQPGHTTWERLHHHLLTNYHSNSPVAPIVVGALGTLIPDIVTAFRIVSLGATLATLPLLVVISKRDLGLRGIPVLIVAFLFTASGAVGRSLLFPQTDAVAMFLFALSVERLLAFRRSDGWGGYVSSIIAMALALFSKLSALPLLGIAAAIVVWPIQPDSSTGKSPSAMPTWRSYARWVVSRCPTAVAVVVPPLAAVVLYVSLLGTTNSYRTEFVRIATLDSQLSFHLIACVVTLLPLLLALIFTFRRTWTATEALFVAMLMIYLGGLWGSGASGWERFYLNALPMALPLAVARFAPLREMKDPWSVLTLCVAYAVAHGVRMGLDLYNGA